MPGPENDNESAKMQDARDHLANERTLLAWIRTSIGIMAFGFVVVKFSLFIKQLGYLMGSDIAVPPQGSSSVIGIMLVAVGSVVLLLAFIKYKQTERDLMKHAYRSSSTLVLLLTFAVLAISIALIIYLIGNSLSIQTGL
jgi:putative membrane protein